MGDETGQRGVLLRLVSLTGHETRALGEAMVAVPVMSSRDGRQQVLKYVKDRNHAFDPLRSSRDTEDVVNFITACQADDESFDLLLEALETRTACDDPQLLELNRLIATLLPRALLTCGELQALLALNLDTIAGPDKLPIGMRRAVCGEADLGDRDFKPSNIRQAMLLLLDDPSPEEGLLRLLRFVHWLAQLAPLLGEDPSTADQLSELLIRVGCDHGITAEAWQSQAASTRQDVADAIAVPAQQGEERYAEAETENHERGADEVQDRSEWRYFVNDKNISPATQNSYEQPLLDLENALKKVQPIIFRDLRVRNRRLSEAKTALEAIGPLMAALSKAVREESRQPMLDDLLQLEDDLRKYFEVLSDELSALENVRSPGAARKPCGRLASAVAEFLSAGTDAVPHVT